MVLWSSRSRCAVPLTRREVRRWWPRYDVRPVGGGTKRLHHPALGDVAFQHAVLQVADQPEQMLVYFTTTEVPQSKLAALAAEIG